MGLKSNQNHAALRCSQGGIAAFEQFIYIIFVEMMQMKLDTCVYG